MRSSPLPQRLFHFRSCLFELTCNFLVHRACFFARAGCFFCSTRQLGAPGLDFWAGDGGRFRTCFHCVPTRAAETVQSLQNTGRSCIFVHQSFHTTTQKRIKVVLRSCSTVRATTNTMGHHSGTVRECLRIGPGPLLDGSQALLARPGRPKIAFGSVIVSGRSLGVPDASRARPRVSLKRL